MTATVCELCAQDGGEVLYRCDKYRVILVDDVNYPGFCRVIWNHHAKEMTDLSWPDRTILMNAVWLVEQALREVMHPDKVNVASLGNVVPHLHWHVIPRYADDAHFPSPIWAAAHRTTDLAKEAGRVALLPALRKAIVKLLTE